MRVPFFGKIISRCSVQLDPQKLHVLNDIPPATNKKKPQLFFRDYELLRQVLPSNSRSVSPSAETDLSKGRLYME